MTTSFSAVDPALGYLSQVGLALLWSLRRARSGTDFVVRAAPAEARLLGRDL